MNPMTDLLEGLKPRMMAKVEALRPHDRRHLDQLMAACCRLAVIRPIYQKVPVFSIGDALDELDGDADEWTRRIIGLRDLGMLALHRTIPAAAASLGLVTIPDGSGVASAISFPARLWRGISRSGPQF